VAKINPNGLQGQQLQWSTYFGGLQSETGAGIAIDVGAANVYLTGTTNSTDITRLQTFAAFQTCLDQYPNPAAGTPCTNSTPTTATYPNDGYVARFSNPTTTSGSPTNVGLTYFSYLGGSADEAGLAIAVDSASGALVTGWTKSSDFPVVPANNDIQGQLLGPQNAFMARLNTVAAVGQPTAASWSSYYGGSGTDEGTSVALDVNGNSYFAGDTNSTDLRLNGQLPPSQGGNYNGGFDAFVTQVGSSSSVTISGVVTLGNSQTFISAGNPATFTYTVTNTGPDLASNLVVLDNISAAFTQVPLTFTSATATSGTCSSAASTSATVACTIPTLQAGSTATVTFVLTPTPATNSGGAQQNFNGGTVQVLGANNIILAQTSVAAKMSDYTMSVIPSSRDVAAGETAQYEVQLFPHPVYATGISLSCSGTPPASACNFTTSPVSLLGPGSSTLNITTTVRPIVTPTASLLTRRFYAVWLCIPGLAIFGLGAGDRRRRRVATVLMLCALFGILLLQPACSKGSTPVPTSGTPAGNYTITVNATSGSDTKTTNVQLNVH
jgi:uncharacterized repeat protein (TIGR01451 family)